MRAKASLPKTRTAKMQAGKLREKIRAEQRGQVSDGGGGYVDSWTTYKAGIPAQIVAVGGREQVLERRMAGVVDYEIVVRHSSNTSGITEAMRIVDERSGQIYNIGPPRTDQRKRMVFIPATIGTASG